MVKQKIQIFCNQTRTERGKITKRIEIEKRKSDIIYSFWSSSTSSFFCHPVVGFSILNCTVSHKNFIQLKTTDKYENGNKISICKSEWKIKIRAFGLHTFMLICSSSRWERELYSACARLFGFVSESVRALSFGLSGWGLVGRVCYLYLIFYGTDHPPNLLALDSIFFSKIDKIIS